MSNPTTTTKWRYLAPNPKSSYRQLFIAGTRIRARSVYGSYMSYDDEPRTSAELARDYGIPEEAVLEAIAYCESDPPEIREDFAREQRLVDAHGINEFGGMRRLLTPDERARIMNS